LTPDSLISSSNPDLSEFVFPKDAFLPDFSQVETCQRCLWPYLFQAAEMLNSMSVQFKKVIAAILDMAMTLTGTERGFLVLFDRNGKPRVELNRNFSSQTFASESARTSRHILKQVLKTGKSTLHNGLDNSPISQSLVQMNVVSVICVPLRMQPSQHRNQAVQIDLFNQNGIIGALYVDSSKANHELTADDVSMLEALATLAVTAILNAYLFRAYEENIARQRALDYAQQVQKYLIPEDKTVNGFAIAGRYEVSEEIGGDYFDVFDLADGRTAVVVGDVSGHGVGPGLLMASTRAYLRRLLLEEPNLVRAMNL